VLENPDIPEREKGDWQVMRLNPADLESWGFHYWSVSESMWNLFRLPPSELN